MEGKSKKLEEEIKQLLEDSKAENDALKKLIVALPNPTTGRFALSQKNGNPEGTVHLEIFSMRGERLYASGVVNDQKHAFDVSFLPAGSYCVKIVKGEHAETIKLIVNK